jgi:hypothetical protein
MKKTERVTAKFVSPLEQGTAWKILNKDGMVMGKGLVEHTVYELEMDMDEAGDGTLYMELSDFHGRALGKKELLREGGGIVIIEDIGIREAPIASSQSYSDDSQLIV